MSRAEERDPSPVVDVARRASRFSREYVATMISLATTALGVVTALAWNQAFATALRPLSQRAQVVGLVIYAALVTAIAVLVIVSLGKLAGRIGAEPVQFQYPAKPGEDKD